MAHDVHTTRALVVGSSAVQDADKLFWLLTEDFGLLFASAKSIREESSKLRYVLQDLAEVRISLVRGRGLWRITGAEEVASAGVLQTHEAEIFGKIAALLRRVVPTDELYSDLFDCVCNARNELLQGEYDTEIVETLTVARMLYQLGYLSCTHEYRGVVDVVHFDENSVQVGTTLKQKLIHDINNGLTESQL